MSASAPHGNSTSVALTQQQQPQHDHQIQHHQTQALVPVPGGVGVEPPPGMKLGEDFPMVCESCLGDNPYVRMTRAARSKQCALSGNPFNAFRWKTGSSGKVKETIVSYPVAAEKNVCQSCLCDMEYGLPMGVRDAFLRAAAKEQGTGTGGPITLTNQAFQCNQNQALVERGETHAGGSGEASSQAMLAAARNMDADGGGSRTNAGVGATRAVGIGPCVGAFAFPELHESHSEAHASLVAALKEDGAAAVMGKLGPEVLSVLRSALASSSSSSSVSNKRGLGSGDAAARYNNANKKGRTNGAEAPMDPTVTTLVVSKLPEGTTMRQITDVFQGYGDVKQVRLIERKHCAFVEYHSRSAAELAAADLSGSCLISGQVVRLGWAIARRGDRRGPGRGGHAGNHGASSATPPPPPPPPPPPSQQQQNVGLRGGAPAPPPPPGMEAGDALPAAPAGLKVFAKK